MDAVVEGHEQKGTYKGTILHFEYCPGDYCAVVQVTDEHARHRFYRALSSKCHGLTYSGQSRPMDFLER